MRQSSVTGERHVKRALTQLGKNLATPVGEASRFALRPIVGSAKRNLKANGTRRTGQLAKSLVVKKNPRSPKVKPQFLVGPRSDSDAVKYAHLVEFGTAPHMQTKLNRLHPGASAKPFLTPAFLEQADNVVKRYGSKLGPAIEKKAKRLAAKQRKGEK